MFLVSFFLEAHSQLCWLVSNKLVCVSQTDEEFWHDHLTLISGAVDLFHLRTFYFSQEHIRYVLFLSIRMWQKPWLYIQVEPGFVDLIFTMKSLQSEQSAHLGMHSNWRLLVGVPTIKQAPFKRLMLKQKGVRAVWEYPFAVAGINISYMLIQLLELNSGIVFLS